MRGDFELNSEVTILGDHLSLLTRCEVTLSALFLWRRCAFNCIMGQTRCKRVNNNEHYPQKCNWLWLKFKLQAGIMFFIKIQHKKSCERWWLVLSRIDSTQFPSNNAIWNEDIKYLSPRFCTKVVIIYQCTTSEDSSRNQFSERREASVNCILHGINQFASPLRGKKTLNTYLLPFFRRCSSNQ